MTQLLLPQVIDIWQLPIPDWVGQISDLVTLLNEHELQRANRFKFAIHRERFIIARAFLRKILSYYTDIPAEKIEFDYGQYGKPCLAENRLEIQFNISHSHDVAVYCVTKKAQIGIDVEKIESSYKEAVAKRFFSPKEYLALSTLQDAERTKAFYQIWVKKEAVIKALGKGLYVPLSDFSLQWDQLDEKIMMGQEAVYLRSFNVDEFYPAAIAVLEPISEIKYQSLSLLKGN